MLSSRAGPLAALLLLADGRFPAGGHAHSGDLEAAVSLEGVCDITTLEVFLRGRLATAGAVAAAFAAAACARLSCTSGSGVLLELDHELEARLPSPALRTASRRLGRQLLRAGCAVWPHPALNDLVAALPRGPHHAVALGAVASAAGLDPPAAASTAVHDATAGPAAAAIRLLGLDPFAVHALLARLAPQLDAIAAQGAANAHMPSEALPARGAPLLDLLAQQHAAWEVRLFAS